MSEWAATEETPGQRWRRRALTLPAYGVAAVTLWAGLPILLPAAACVDWIRDARWARVRILLFAAHYLACESLGLLLSFTLWLAQVARPDAARSEDLHYALQDRWAAWLFAGVRRLFAVRLEVEAPENLSSGPVLVFIRHASLVDTLLPAIVLSRRSGLRLRYVLKRELLWDPCLDVVGQRLPHLFVHRQAPDSTVEIRRVARLAEGLTGAEGVLIYPEGTRFTPGRRERAIARIERGGDASQLARARRLRHVLPPRTGGPLALLEACPEADLLLVAHVGLEGISHLGDVVAGKLTGRRIGVQVWRLPRSSVPREREKQIDWLYDAWELIDAWIEEQRSGAKSASGTVGGSESA